MRLAILSDEALKSEFLQKNIPSEVEILWTSELSDFVKTKADVYMDLLFKNYPEHVDPLKTLIPKPIFINAVTQTLEEIEEPFIRINAWPSFLSRNISEIAIATPEQEKTVDIIFKTLGWEYIIVPDTIGMLTPRVVAMIVNEAYFALDEQVSTKEEIDIAMKLGTNYPYGPFEWGDKIGLNRIRALLTKLSIFEDRYTLAEALE